MKAYNISIKSGQQEEAVIAEWDKSEIYQPPNFGGGLRAAADLWWNFTDIPESFNNIQNSSFAISRASQVALSNRLYHPGQNDTVVVVTNFGSTSQEVLPEDGTPYSFSPTSDLASNLFNVTDYNAWIQQFALSMTNHLRTYGDPLPDDTNAYAGTTLSSEIYVHIKWPWLIYPAVLVFASILFLAATIW